MGVTLTWRRYLAVCADGDGTARRLRHEQKLLLHRLWETPLEILADFTEH